LNCVEIEGGKVVVCYRKKMHKEEEEIREGRGGSIVRS
jgi:hypothetical protein